MNKRQLNILKQLNETIEYITTVDLATEYKCSRMTISKDLDVLEYKLNKENVYLERKQGLGIRIFNVEKNKAKVERLIDKNVMKNDVSNFDDRRIKILIYLLLNSDSYTPINKLAKDYYISRTSIYNDLDNLKEVLSSYKMSIEVGNKGVRVVGREADLRALLANLIIHIVGKDASYIYEYQDLRHDGLRKMDDNDLFDKDLINFIEKTLNDIEFKLRMVINEPYYTNLLTHLMIMINRVRQGNVLEEDIDVIYLKKNSIYKACIYLVQELEKHCQIEIPESEKYYIYRYLNSIGIEYEERDHRSLSNREELFAQLLLEVLAQMNYIDADKDPEIRKKILLHIKPMLNRLDYQIIIKNPLVDDFKANYKKDFILVKIASLIICDQMDLKAISDDEIAYLLSYVLIKKDLEDDRKIKTCVICYSGVGTSEFLAKQVDKEFSEVEIREIISFKSFESKNLEDMDLILSTVKLDRPMDYLQVSAFLSDVDKVNIKEKIASINKKRFIKLEAIEEKRDHLDYRMVFEDRNLKVFIRKANTNSLYKHRDSYYLDYKDYFYINNAIDNILE